MIPPSTTTKNPVKTVAKFIAYDFEASSVINSFNFLSLNILTQTVLLAGKRVKKRAGCGISFKSSCLCAKNLPFFSCTKSNEF